MSNSDKSHTPLISVIIPVLNNKKQFVFCLNSVLRNSVQTVEIIIIDGGSSDGTLSVIDDYAEHISYWESGHDSGIADAFNRGISKAKGEIIAILNSDDYWEQDTVRYILEAYEQVPDADVFYGDLHFLKENLQEEPEESYIKKPSLKKMKYRMSIFHPAMFVNRVAFKKVGLFRLDYKHAMDSEWCHRALNNGLKFHYVPHLLATMRLGGVSDREFKQSLQEYRRSVILNKLTTPFKASVYFYFFLLMKYFMKFSLMRKLKYRLYNIRSNKGR